MKLLILCFLCLANFSLAIFFSKIYYILALFFGISIILFKFHQLELMILEKKKEMSICTDKKNQKIGNVSAEEHPIIVSARQRLNKK